MRSAREIADTADGRLVGDPEVRVSGASIDSRTIAPGELFVPIVDERDGHEFIDAALEAGAAAYLTTRSPTGGTAVVVEDTRSALSVLGEAARSRLHGEVVGVTGSVGKTTVKDLIASVLAEGHATSASLRSFNNELGVPLTLFNAPSDAEAVVVEMGARGVGHIASLCGIAHPTIGVVTTVGLAHTELFGSLASVAEAKGELVEALPAGGTAVLNGDVDLVAAMADRTAARVLLFGRVAGDVTASDVEVDDDLRAAFRLHSPWGEASVRLGVRGEHQVANALAAAAGSLAAGASLDDVVAGLADVDPSPWRMDLRRVPSGAVVLNDAYNANPASTEAALRALARVPARRRLAVLGPMAELGPHAVVEHGRIVSLAAGLQVRVVAVGAPVYPPDVEHVPDIDGALAALGPVGDGDAVLVKGSRIAGLERLADRLSAP
jgi:UDP-N-acetylmuramoyl-tripeptide--D-alanyl-D-alanine ligase